MNGKDIIQKADVFGGIHRHNGEDYREPYTIIHRTPIGRGAKGAGKTRVEVWARGKMLGYKTEYDQYRFALITTGNWHNDLTFAYRRLRESESKETEAKAKGDAYFGWNASEMQRLIDWLRPGRPAEFDLIHLNSWHTRRDLAERAPLWGVSVTAPWGREHVESEICDIVEIPEAP